MILTTKRNDIKSMNKSYSYLLPLFNEECPVDGDFYIVLENVYTRYNEKEGYFVLCYKNVQNENFYNYVSRLHENKLFVESYTEEEFLYLVFNFPDAFKYEYNCYLNGKFSKFRDSAKRIIVEYVLKTHKEASAESVRRVLNRDPALRDSIEKALGIKLDENSELSSFPNKASETCFNFNIVENG